MGLRAAGRRDPRPRCNRRARGGQRLPVQSLRLRHRPAPRPLAKRRHGGAHLVASEARRDARGADAGGAAANARLTRLARRHRTGRRTRCLVRVVQALRSTAGTHCGGRWRAALRGRLRAQLPRALRGALARADLRGARALFSHAHLFGQLGSDPRGRVLGRPRRSRPDRVLPARDGGRAPLVRNARTSLANPSRGDRRPRTARRQARPHYRDRIRQPAERRRPPMGRHLHRGSRPALTAARLYRGFCDAFAQAPSVSGFYVWNWFGFGGPRDLGFTPRGKPAANELAKCFARPRPDRAHAGNPS